MEVQWKTVLKKKKWKKDELEQKQQKEGNSWLRIAEMS